jgi:hypothetical protein
VISRVTRGRTTSRASSAMTLSLPASASIGSS